MNLPFPKEGACLADEEIVAYLDHSAEDADRLERHLAGCGDCLDLLLGARRAKESEASVSERLTARIVAMGPSRRNPSIRRFLERRRTNPFFGLAAAAAVILVGIVAVLSLTEHRPPPGRAPENAIRTEEPPGDAKTEIAERTAEPRRDTEAEHLRKDAIAEASPIRVEAVAGRLRCGDRELKGGDFVRASDTLRTRFAESARLEVAGTTLVLHHETEFALAVDGAIRLKQGKLLLRGNCGWSAETPAGTVSGLGAEASLEVVEGVTAIVVKSGDVLFRNDLGARRIEKGLTLRCGRDEVPPFPSRVADLNAAFAWTGRVERAARSANGTYLMLYPATRRGGLVVTAPHMPVESQTARFAASVAEQRKASLVVASGFKRIRQIEVNVPGATIESLATYEEYRRLVSEAADRTPLDLLVEIHGYGGEDDPPVIEIATTGFTVQELGRLKQAYARLLQKHRPGIGAMLVFEATDPAYEVGGKKIRYQYGVGALATHGIFRKDIAARGWKVELPYVCRYAAREKYEAIVSDLIAEALR